MTPAAEWRRGWPIVLGAAAGSATGLGLLFYVASLFVGPLTHEFGWTRGQIAGATALSGIGAFAAPVVGYLIDRFGVRVVTAICTLVISGCYVGLARMQNDLAMFTVYVTLIGVVGIGTIGFAYTRPIAAWFMAHRGFALGVSASGVSITALVAPPLLQWLITEHGWRAGYMALAMVALLVGLPLSLLLLRDRPPADEDGQPSEMDQAQPGVTRSQAIRDTIRVRSFWLLAVAIFCVNAAGSGALSQISPLLTDRGFSAARAALGVSAYAGGLLFGRLACGWLLDRGVPWRVAFAFTSIPALGIIILMFPGIGFVLALASCFLIGLQQGSELDVMAYLVAKIFGIRTYATIYGVIYVAGILGTAVGTYVFGHLFDLYHSYSVALIAAAISFLIGATAFLLTGADVKSSLHTQS
jgi:predicted MFS family arabinose efflux permease